MDFDYYSVCHEYYATGEGTTIGVMYTPASSIEHALQIFERSIPYGNFFIAGAVATIGIRRDAPFSHYFSKDLMKLYRGYRKRKVYAGPVVLHYHVNFS